MNMEQIYNEAFRKTIEEACKEVICQGWGSGIDSEVKDEIRKVAKEILETEEMKDLIKERILYWISRQ